MFFFLRKESRQLVSFETLSSALHSFHGLLLSRFIFNGLCVILTLHLTQLQFYNIDFFLCDGCFSFPSLPPMIDWRSDWNTFTRRLCIYFLRHRSIQTFMIFLYFELFLRQFFLSRFFERDKFNHNTFNAWFTGRHLPTLCERSEAKCFPKSSLWECDFYQLARMYVLDTYIW